MLRYHLEDQSKDELIDAILEKDREKDKLINIILKKEKENERLRKEKEKLEKELRKYKNPDTPSSAHSYLKPAVSQIACRSKKRGAPFGHIGTTRLRKTAGESRHITSKECPNCHSKDLRVLTQKHQQLEEYPQDIQPKVVDVIRNTYRCNECKQEFVARDGQTPLQGRFGLNIIVLVVFLRFILRGVLRKTTSFLESSLAMRLAPASVQAIIERAAKAGEAEYLALKEKIRTAPLLYIDETSFSVLGKNWWVWVFRSDTDLLFVIRNSRGNKVLKEVLGEDYAGVIVCDCWRAYDLLSNASLQRCWAHLLRRSAELESVAGRHMHKKLSSLFKQIDRFNRKDRTQPERQRKYEQLTAKLQKIISYYSRYEECEATVKYVGFHLESWFTCVRLPGVQPTNNYAEQAIRETVLVRKIIGAFRSHKGVKTYETLASLIATWNFQKKDLKAELCRMLSANLC